MEMERFGVDENSGFTMIRNGSFRGSEDNGGDSAFYEKFLLEDWDSYWDDLNSRLTVSRMVNDSIIKGMVNGVVEDADEKVALKDVEIAMLNERLRGCRLDVAELGRDEKIHVRNPLDVHIGHFGRLHIAVQEQLGNVRRVKSLGDVDKKVDDLGALIDVLFAQIDGMFGSPEASACEQQMENEIQREVMDIVTRGSIRAIHDEFETKLYEQREISSILSKNCQTTLDELSNMRRELDVICRSFSPEQGSLLSYNSIENFEERHAGKGNNSPRKMFGNHHISVELQHEEPSTSLMEKVIDSPKPMLEDVDSPKLKHMTKEEVMVYYKTEMLKMSRLHDQVVQDKTEALFKLKREFLKEKGSSHLRKDKDFEISRRKIPEVISKLDNIIFLNKKLPSVNCDDHEELSKLKKRIDALLFENQQLRTLLADQRKEDKSMSSLERNFLDQIEKLKCDVDDLNIEAEIRCNVYSSILKELVDEHKCGMEDVQSTVQIMHSIHFLIFRGAVHDAMTVAMVNPSDSKYCMEKASLEDMLTEKENALSVALDENKKMKQDLSSLMTSMTEKEKLLSDSEFSLVQQGKNYDLLNLETVMLRGQVSEQEALLMDKDTELVAMKDRLDETLQQIQQLKLEIVELNHKFEMASELLADKNKDLVSMKGRLDETLQQIQQHKLETDELNDKLKMASETLFEIEEQNTILSSMVEEKQKAFSSSFTDENKQLNQMKNIVVALIEDLEDRLFENIQVNESRLKVLNRECLLLRRHASLLQKKGAWYQQIIDLKSCNLQKAEAEVDLLGDEVDALMSLLGKIYIALDHYSPIFELYPGVTEILKLVQRKLKGEANMLM